MKTRQIPIKINSFDLLIIGLLYVKNKLFVK